MLSIVLRLLPYIAVVALIVGVGWYTVDSAYEHGRKMERLEWMEHEEILKRQADIRIAQLEYKMRTEREKADRRATQIIGAYANEIENLTLILTALMISACTSQPKQMPVKLIESPCPTATKYRRQCWRNQI